MFIYRHHNHSMNVLAIFNPDSAQCIMDIMIYRYPLRTLVKYFAFEVQTSFYSTGDR